MGSGIRLAKELGSPEAAQAIDDMKDQLLIALVNRLGGTVEMEASEIDASGQWNLLLSLDGKKFTFRSSQKQ